jgi:hypothetical protein
MCLGFHCPICDSLRCDNGVTFRVVNYVLFLGFLSGPAEPARVIICKCCKDGIIDYCYVIIFMAIIVFIILGVTFY